MSEIIFRADSITKSFGAHRVLHTATLWARRGTIGALLGRNGSGKSTLFRIAAGLLTHDQGVILYDGAAIERPRLHTLARRGVFMLPERDMLPRGDTIRTLLRMTTDRFGGEERSHDVIGLLRIDELLDRLPETMSGGEKRRAEVAIATVRSPRVLFADEPFMGIAPRDADIVADALRRLAAAGCAIVISGHEVNQVLDVADEVVWMAAGTTHSLGTAAQAREHWQFRREYLGMATGTYRRGLPV